MEERIIQWQQYGVTVINPLGLVFAILMWSAILFLKREYKVLPFLLIGCFMTSMQRVVIFDLDFPYIRIAILIGLTIVVFSKKYILELNKIDKIMLCYMASTLVLNTCLMGLNGLIQKLGYSIDTVLAYFFLRYIFEDIKDFNVIMKVLAVASVVIAVFMLNEKLTGRNWFSIFGGVPEFTMIRDGKLRAQAAIDHPILAGTFGALLIPFMWSLWNQKMKLYAIIGAISGIIITFASASSGPVLTLMACFWGIIMWKFREKRKYFVPIIFFIIVLLQLFMKRPFWYIFANIDITGGSTGYHRSELIHQAIMHFPEWILYGTQSSGQWAWGLQDTTNQYLKEGFDAGFLSLVLFLYIIITCFKYIGNSLNYYNNGSIENQKTVWALGVMLFAHCTTFFGVSYFGHLEFFYYMILAMISSLNNFTIINNIKQQARI